MGSGLAGRCRKRRRMVTREQLRRLAGARFYERGDDYFETGRVRSFTETADAVTATVRGNRNYRVALAVGGGKLAHSCTCPLGAEGVFCKHGVAVGLEWLARGGGGRSVRSKAKRHTVTMDDVRTYLTRQDTAVLVNILIEHAKDDDRLRE